MASVAQSTTVVEVKETPDAVATLDDRAFEGLNFPLLARELARRIHKAETVARRFGLSPAQIMLLIQHAPFARMVKIERAVWEGSDNAGERVKTYHREAQAQFASDIALRMVDPNLAPSVQLDYAKFSAKLAGLDVQPREKDDNVQATGNAFSVTINLGDGRVERIATIQHEPAPALE